ncbi:hypothetical protein DW856_19295 [Roseburia intestinalis]|uniref:DEAD/DEAH box helicase n=2 Tax=Roseburia intestinalis TaxID=166486 RepID=A0A3R6ATV4_9FIRM|nr:hypothetical protein DW856_19295 [Roseburia intestinalis]
MRIGSYKWVVDFDIPLLRDYIGNWKIPILFLFQFPMEEFMNTVTDKIGEEYKQWSNYNKIFISAPTGSGKTYFILNVLLPFACSQNRKILFLVNRKILKLQLEKEISNFPFEIAKNITIETYQTLEKKYCEIKSDIRKETINIAGNTVLQYYENHDYVVCDECHYFLTDSNYNTNTGVSFRWIQEMFAHKIRIFMSATIDEIEDIINKNDKKMEHQCSQWYYKDLKYMSPLALVQQRKVVYKYNIESNYDYVSVNILENYNDLIEAVENGSKKKWMIFVDSIVYGKQLEKTLKDKLECDSIIFITTDYKKDVDGIREVDEISRESMFSKRILITTAVLDNGVNIKDLELQNIVVCADTEEQFIQMLGRKRKDGINTNLYIFKRDKVHFQRRLAMVEKVRKIAINYMKTFEKWLNGDEKYYISKEGWLIQEQHCQIMKKMAENELDYKDVMKVFWVYGGILMLNLLAYHHLEILCSYYQRIIECFSTYGDNAFLQEQLKWLGKNKKETDEVINGCMKSRLDEARENVIDAMEQNKEKEMTKEEAKAFKLSIKDELVELIRNVECPKEKLDKVKGCLKKMTE